MTKIDLLPCPDCGKIPEFFEVRRRLRNNVLSEKQYYDLCCCKHYTRSFRSKTAAKKNWNSIVISKRAGVPAK